MTLGRINGNQSWIGFSDAPAQEDNLSLESYISGLATFIQTCVTPMTIAIQGDWGTGKSTWLELLKQRLPTHGNAVEQPSIKLVEFNAWPYSQFDLGDRLPFSLMEAILLALDTDEKQGPKIKRALGTLSRIAAAIAYAGLTSAASLMPGGQIMQEAARAGVDATQAQFDQRREAQSSEYTPSADLTMLIRRLRDELADAISTSLPRPEDRLVVFIDDLDRLQPIRAIEVMEAMKVFLDIDRCVFVLAIDFDVVASGVKDKYGRDFDDRKARSFFDKIIQVPFQLPVNSYDITEPLRSYLTPMNLASLRDDLKPHATLFATSVGTNPRAGKRMINAFVLAHTINKHRGAGGASDLDLFSAMCFQVGYPVLFTEIVRRSKDGEYLRELRSAVDFEDWQDAAALEQLDKWRVDPHQGTTLATFVEELATAFDDDEDRFARAISAAAVTAVGETPQQSPRSREYLAGDDLRKELLGRGKGQESVDLLLTLIDRINEAEVGWKYLFNVRKDGYVAITPVDATIQKRSRQIGYLGLAQRSKGAALLLALGNSSEQTQDEFGPLFTRIQGHFGDRASLNLKGGGNPAIRITPIADQEDLGPLTQAIAGARRIILGR